MYLYDLKGYKNDLNFLPCYLNIRKLFIFYIYK